MKTVQVSRVQKRTIGVDVDLRFDNLRGSLSPLTLKMTSDKVVETSVNINTNCPSLDSTNLDDLHRQTDKNVTVMIKVVRRTMKF